MIVLDASAALELLLRTAVGAKVERLLFDPGERLHAPHLIDLEVVQVIRRRVQAGRMSAEDGAERLDVWRAFPVRRWPHEPFIGRIWALRTVLTAYDAAYVALAEAIEAPLVTTDARVAGASGHTARVDVVRLDAS